ncbi:MAG: hypothetical protein D6733_01705 [Methanobacteriota archaeon]|nr:MAG: hypothetical protein D6733_01705 [Euryarchaeota archaeon]
MDGGNLRWRMSAACSLLLLLFLSAAAGSAYGQCTPRSADEMKSYLIDMPNYTKVQTKVGERIASGKVIATDYQTTYVKPYRSVDIELLDYDDEAVAAQDAALYPTPTDGQGWNATTFRGHQAYLRTVELVSSEYLDYTAELRVVEGCTVVRGFWHEKIRKYETLVTPEEGRESLETVVGAIVDVMFGPPAAAPPPTPSPTPPATSPPPPETSPPQPETPKTRIVVLANSIDYSLAAGFFGFLEGRGFDVVHVTAADFDQYKTEPFIVILGGPDAPEGVGEVVQGILTMAEGESIRKAGARRLYIKTDRWTSGQKVAVIAGSNRQETAMAEDESRAEIASEAASA